MKIKSTLISLTVLCCLSVINPYHSHATVTPKTTTEIGDDKNPAAKAKSKISTSRNNDAVRIYPGLISKTMHVVAKDNEQEIQFFVFDLDSTLIQHFKMKDGDHKKIRGLRKGKYVYHVFSGDEEVATGNFSIH
ncbi:MAG: hypothetical protein J7527_05145 [Chitinophagaceae bacterium]|nr:hypothetical protein [Chitinophagaceae bacterium]